MQGLAALAAAAVLFTVGCVAPPPEGPRDPPSPLPARPAEICVLRAAPAGADTSYAVRDNDALVATVAQDYFCRGVAPGPHRITVEAGARSATIELTVAPGERVFLRQSLAGEALALARLSEAAPPAPPVAAVSPRPAPPVLPPTRPPSRPEGLVYGADAGVGLASSRTAPATQVSGSLAALGSIVIGMWPTDYLLLGGRVDASLMNGAGVGDIAVHIALFPGAGRAGWRRDFALFVDGGIATPISAGSGVTSAPSVAGVARIGVGLQRWRLGPTVLGPLLCGQIVRSSGEADAAVLAGLTANLTSSPRGK